MLNFAGWESVEAIQHNQYLREVEVYPFTGDIYEDAKVTITPSDNPQQLRNSTLLKNHILTAVQKLRQQ